MNLVTKKDLAEAVQDKGFNIHYYACMGLLKTHKNPENGWNYYDLDTEPFRIQLIHELQKLGKSIVEIREIMGKIKIKHLIKENVFGLLSELNKEIESIESKKKLFLKIYNINL